MARARTVLIVDDEADFRHALRELLEDQGCSVCEAEDGRSALAKLRSYTPDLLITDLLMPIMDGWALRAALRRDPRLARVPVAVLTAVDDTAPGEFTHVLHKPVTLPNLLTLLQALEAPNVRTAPVPPLPAR